MSSLITPVTNFSSSSSSPLFLPTRRQSRHHNVFSVLRFSKPNLGLSCSCQRRATKVWGGGGDPELEAEVLEFMKGYSKKNPVSFPSKEELIASGRMDLVRRIVEQGGWFSYGWDLETTSAAVSDDQTRNDGAGAGDECTSLDGSEPQDSASSSSSGRTMEGMEDTGIEGILSRLDKLRTESYGFVGSKKETKLQDSSWNHEGKYLKPGSQDVNGSESSSSESWSSDMWRKWSYRRARVSETEFEAAEIGEDSMRNDEIVEELRSSDKEKDYNHVRSCLQEMALELDSVLQELKCTADLVVSDKLKYSPKELHSLSDAWEFRETEIVKAKNKLRSIQAQLAVLDGKTALKIIEAQQMVVEKQKKIRDRQKASSLLQTACVTWPKSASEVLLVGSFDGWTSQRKMKRTNLGIFSMTLKLYPGRYEIKFVVDGMWAVDPLRPIVNNKGHQNNLLIVS